MNQVIVEIAEKRSGLVLGRRPGESIIISGADGDIEITYAGISAHDPKGLSAKLIFKAPKEYNIARKELLNRGVK